MKDVQELLTTLNSTDEHNRVEAKSCATGQLGKAVLKTLSSFSNEPGLDGGYIVFGVKRIDGIYETIGVDDPDKLQLELSTTCNSEFNEAIRPTIQVEQVDAQTVIVAYIPEMDPSRKPVYREAAGLSDGTFRRIGSSDIKCTNDDLEKLFRQRKELSFDATTLAGASWKEDFDEEALAAYRSTIEKHDPDSELLAVDDLELLRALKCVKIEDDRWVPTVAGLLLFGKKLTLRREFPMAARIDYIRVPGTIWVEDPDERYESVEFREPLATGIRRIVRTVMDDVPRAVSIGSDQLERKETPRVPASVVREAVVNAVMHRNYRQHRPTQIIRFSNRIEIENAGHSLKPHDELGQTGSAQRNPRLASILHEMKLAESKGTGIKAMRRDMKKAGLNPPVFVSKRESDTFAVTFRLKHFLSEENLDWLASLDETWELDDEEKYALVYVRENESISNAELRDITGDDTLKASRKLGRLRDLGLLEMEGAGSATYYTPGAELTNSSEPATGLQTSLEDLETSAVENRESEQQTDETHKQTDETHKQTDETHKQTDETHKQTDETHKQTDETHKQTDETHKQTDETHKQTDETHKQTDETGPQVAGDQTDSDQKSDTIREIESALPEHLRVRIREAREKSRIAGFEELVLDVCTERPFSSSELAALLDRERRHLVRAYLKPLVEAGQLRRRHPDSPRHPKQAYRTVGSEEE